MQYYPLYNLCPHPIHLRCARGHIQIIGTEDFCLRATTEIQRSLPEVNHIPVKTYPQFNGIQDQAKFLELYDGKDILVSTIAAQCIPSFFTGRVFVPASGPGDSSRSPNGTIISQCLYLYNHRENMLTQQLE